MLKIHPMLEIFMQLDVNHDKDFEIVIEMDLNLVHRLFKV